MRVEAGEVICFNPHHGMGHLRVGEDRLVFIGMCLESGHVPESGDRVRVVFNDIGQILSIRLASFGDHPERVQ